MVTVCLFRFVPLWIELGAIDDNRVDAGEAYRWIGCLPFSHQPKRRPTF